MTVSDWVADSVRRARKMRGLRTNDLAAICAEQGHGHLTHSVLENIESGRRDSDGRRVRTVTVDELFALAEALGCSPLRLLPDVEKSPAALTLSEDEFRVVQRILRRVVKAM